jgi:septum formation protein
MLVLASQSPRRQELLQQAGIPFIVRVNAVNEDALENETPEDYVQRLACEKAEAVECGDGEIVLGADTAVIVKGEIFGKPRDREDAIRMLEFLQGRKHEVLTGVCLRSAKGAICNYASTGVWFSALSRQEIETYVDTGEPMDKAGAYAVQGVASRFVERIDGSYANVVGLPVALVWQMLHENV